MTQELYARCLDIMKTICRDIPTWHKSHTKAVLDDYMVGDFYEPKKALSLIGPRVYARLSAMPVGSFLSRDICMNLAGEMYTDGDGVRIQAYLFAIKLFADILSLNCELHVSDLSEDLIPYHAVRAAAPAAEDLSPAAKRLLDFKSLLLDFSRSNPIVHFKANRSALRLSFPGPGVLLDALHTQNRVYIETWSHADAKQILRCSGCGRQFIRKYIKDTKGQKEHPKERTLACPVCDQGKRTKSAAPIPERPVLVSPSAPLRCRCTLCGAEVRIGSAPVDTLPLCACGAEVPIPSYPLLNADAVRSAGDVAALSMANDNQTLDTVTNLCKSATNLKTNFGLHSLYLACGLLHWTAESGQTYTSPILLCKVDLAIDKTRGQAYVSAEDSDPTARSVNYTLRKMLEHYSDSVSVTFPEYDPAEPFELYLGKLRAALQKFPETASFEVESTAFISKFYYHKLQLEKDLSDHFDTYLEHPAIRKLCGMDDPEMPLGTVPPAASAGTSEIFAVLDADSSQEQVLAAARRGESFILQGPPGTGKSQTICNIIADAVGNGRTVLFVTEKAAARSVISDNFEACVVDGSHRLTEYILNVENVSGKRGTGEINKTDLKKFFNDHFEPSMRIPLRGKQGDNIFYEERIRNLYDTLVTVPSGGMSVLQIIEQWIPFASYEDVVFPGIAMKDIVLPEVVDFITNYYAAAGDSLDYTQSPLHGYIERDLLTPGYHHIRALHTALTELAADADTLRDTLGYTLPWRGFDELEEAVSLLKRMAEMPDVCLSLMAENRAQALTNPDAFLSELLDYVQQRAEAKSTIQGMQYYELDRHVHLEKLVQLDLPAHHEKLEHHRFFLRRMGKEYQALKATIVGILREPPARMDYNRCVYYTERIERCLETHTAIQAFEAGFDEDSRRLGALSRGWNTRFDSLVRPLTEGIAILRSASAKPRGELLAHMLDDLCAGIDPHAVLRETTAGLENRLSAIRSHYTPLTKGVFDQEIVKFKLMNFQTLIHYLARFDRPKQEIANWVKLQMLLHNIRSHTAMKTILQELIRKSPACARDAVGIVSKAHYLARIMSVFNAHSDLLVYLERSSMQDLIDEYSRHDLCRLQSASAYLYNRLVEAKNRMRAEFATRSTRKNLITRYKGVSIKDLIRDNWNEIRAITPCIMMSPLNVSQYLDISVTFDMVIFDEASQIFLEEALASVVRGRQVIIAGDEQQLPPFNFARASDVTFESDASIEEEFENGDSILTAALRSSLDTHSLRWHYRSADESLICFSNRQFYGNSLVTFPAALHDPEHGIFYHYVEDGCYLAAERRINEREVARVVELLYREITSDVHRDDSIGVVAFNKTQADAIEKAWNKFLESNKDPRVTEWLKREEERHEPLIFCNLDNIQGDERDTVIISTTYGCNPEGIFRLSFLGPIRLENGKKRINVAITRAKRRMMVVTSLTSAQLAGAIAESSGQNVGATVLSEFLQYAESFQMPQMPAAGGAGSAFLGDLCRILDDEGIAYDVNVGLSDYKVQIGIKTSAASESYVLGILTDENGLHGQSVRDLARHRDQVLTGKYAWTLYHVYMLPWFWNYEREKQALLDAVRRALHPSA